MIGRNWMKRNRKTPRRLSENRLTYCGRAGLAGFPEHFNEIHPVASKAIEIPLQLPSRPRDDGYLRTGFKDGHGIMTNVGPTAFLTRPAGTIRAMEINLYDTMRAPRRRVLVSDTFASWPNFTSNVSRG